MIALVKELKTLMDQNGLSPERASHHIGCSVQTVIRWLKNENPPSVMYQQMIRGGIVKIKEAYPTVESDYSLGLKARDLYRKVRRFMTLKEKAELIDIHQEKGIVAYAGKLKELIKKYGVK